MVEPRAEAKVLRTGASGETSAARLIAASSVMDASNASMQTDAPACDVCGSITVRNGTCYKCHNCGNSMGCS